MLRLKIDFYLGYNSKLNSNKGVGGKLLVCSPTCVTYSLLFEINIQCSDRIRCCNLCIIFTDQQMKIKITKICLVQYFIFSLNKLYTYFNLYIFYFAFLNCKKLTEMSKFLLRCCQFKSKLKTIIMYSLGFLRYFNVKNA